MQEFYNPSLIAAMAAWLLAQIIKTLIHLFKSKKISVERMLGAGGMPSSHSAAVCALTAALASPNIAGFKTPVFALALILSMIVMYDASGVRRAAGMHAREINQIKDIIEEFEAEENSKKPAIGEINKDNIEQKKEHLKEFLGHSPLEVFFGAALGIIVGVVIPLF